VYDKSGLFKSYSAKTNTDIKSLSKQVSVKYQRKGYYNLNIDSVDTIHWKLNLGKQYIFKTYLDSAQWSETKLKRLKQAKSLYDINKGFRVLLAELENSGYPFAQFSWYSQLDSDTVNIHITQDIGNYITYDSIVVQPNSIIHPAFVTQYLGIKKGKSYHQKDIDQSQNRINRLAYLQSNAKPKVFYYEQSADVYVFVEKRKSNFFNALLGFQQNSTNGRNTLTGEFNLDLKNTLKRGEQFKTRFNSIQGGALNLESAILYPYILNTPVGIGAELDIYKQDSSFIQQRTGLQIQLFQNGTIDLRVFSERKSSSSFRTNILSDVSSYKKALYGVSFGFNSSNDFYFHSKGIQFRTHTSLGSINANKVVQQRIESRVLAHYFKGFGKRWVYHPFVESNVLFGSGILKNEQLRLGGFSSLRGFDERAFYVDNYSILSNEVRFLLDESSYVFSFADVALSDYSNTNKTNYRVIGTGLSLRTNTGNFIFSYAIGAQKNNPLVLQSGKVHFGFISVF
jgi:hemolysin activation/secretion protein